ncbi:MAG: hypothetical protein U0Q20_05275 [Mycobacterium sp.]|nr:hypothetical protein [Mycobacterium sp.]
MPQLTAAAFGDNPALWPLPPAETAEQRWLRAVAAGGQGHYATAFAELAELRRSATGPLLSLAHSTHGSLLRQLGWHVRARGWDGRALAQAGVEPQARADALVGLAADALGVGRFTTSACLLDQAADLAGPPRLEVRLAWVRAELAMATGDGTAAVTHARRGVELAGRQASVRHRTKSDVVLAAALCCAGRLDESRALAADLMARTAEHGLIPLQWAVASLLTGVGGSPDSASVRDAAAALVEHRGGHWRRA